MPKRIDVPGLGVVEFPDEMSDDQITAVIKSNTSKSPAPQGAAATPTTPAEDPIKATVRKEMEDERAKGIEFGANPTARRIIQGATFNAADEVLATMATPVEMIRRGTLNPKEGYRYAKARQDLELERAREKTGALGTAAEIGGGVLTGSGLARTGLSALRFAPQGANLATRAGLSAADAAAYGGGAGLMEGNTAGERLGNAATGATVGGLVGGAAPVAAALVSPVISPVISNIRARVNPERYARSQLARAMVETNRAPGQVADAVSTAAAEGQPMFTVADALGNPGQRMLATVTLAHGPGRTQAVDFLNDRQGGQGRRIVNFLSEGFEAPQTAAQTEARLTAQRQADARTNYGRARGDANAVNVTPALDEIDRTLRPGATRVVNPGTNIADNSVESTLRRARSFLSDGRSQVSSFDDAFMAKRELDAMIENGSPTIQNALIPVRNALDDQLAAASQSYAAARDTYRQQSQAIRAVQTGRDAAMRGRTEDTIPTFRGMAPAEQAAFRPGYADPLIADVQRAAATANKARPLTGDWFADEGAAFAAPGRGDLMNRRLGRENTMFETRSQAIGGSRTAENLADMEAQRVDPTILTNLLSGNWSGAARNMLQAGGNAMSGYTPAVREQLANLLLMRGQRPDLQPILDEAIRRMQVQQLLMGAVGRGGSAGLAVTPSASGAYRQKP